MNIDIDLNNKILIIPNKIKTKVVKNINNLPKLSNVKILTDQEFITNLTIDYNEKSIISLIICIIPLIYVSYPIFKSGYFSLKNKKPIFLK